MHCQNRLDFFLSHGRDFSLTSIVLAVFAILITLWDVAGQKGNILSMQENLKSFNIIIEDFHDIRTQNELSITELKELIVEMNDNVISYESKFAQIEKKIDESGNDVLKEEIKSIKEQRNASSHKQEIIGINLRIAEAYVKDLLMKRNKIVAKELIDDLAKNFGVSSTIARHTIKTFEARGILKKEVSSSLHEVSE